MMTFILSFIFLLGLPLLIFGKVQYKRHGTGKSRWCRRRNFFGISIKTIVFEDEMYWEMIAIGWGMTLSPILMASVLWYAGYFTIWW